MAEAKDIDNSLEFLRHFEKNTENSDLGSLIREKLSFDKKSLDLLGCRLKEDDFKTIAEANPLKSLLILNLEQTGLNSAGLQPLSFSDCFSNLEKLSLANNNLDDEALFFLSKCKALTLLQDLNLSSNEIGTLGAKVLSLAEGMSSAPRCFSRGFK